MAAIRIEVDAETRAAAQELGTFFAGLEQDLDGLVGSFKTKLAGGLATVFGVGLIKRGVEFNALMQDSRVAIAATLKQFDQTGGIRTFTDALEEADFILDKIVEKAAKSPATVRDLVQAFVGTGAAAASAKADMRELVDFVVLSSQALAGMGIMPDQILQETRALLTGNITEDAAVAKNLGVSRAQVAIWRESGDILSELTGKLGAYMEAAEFAQANFSIVMSNFEDATDQALGQATLPLLRTLTQGFKEMIEIISNPQFAGGFEDIIGVIQLMIQVGFEALKIIAENLDALIKLMETLAIAAGLTLTAWVSLKVAAAATFATGPLGAFLATITLIATTIQMLIERHRQLKAELEETYAKEYLAERDEALLDSVQATLKAAVEARSLPADDLVRFTRQLEKLRKNGDAFGEELKGNLIRGLARAVRTAVSPAAKELGDALKESAAKGIWEGFSKAEEALIAAGQPQLNARVAAEVEAGNAVRALEMERLEIQHRRQLISVQKFLAEKSALMTEQMEEESRLVELELDRIAKARRHAEELEDPAARNAKKLELLGQEQSLHAKLAVLQKGLQAELLKLEDEGRQLREQAEEEARQKREQAAQAETERALEARNRAEQTYQNALRVTSALVADGTLTQARAQARNNEAAQTYRETLAETLQLMERLQAADPAADLAPEIERIKTQMIELRSVIRDPGFLGGMREQLRQLRAEWQDFGTNMAQVLGDGIKRGVNGVTDAIAGALFQTRTWGEVFQQVGRQIITGLIGVVVQWIASMTIMRAMQAIFGVTAMTQAAALAGAWAPAAVGASIATGGGAAAAGSAAYTGSIISGKTFAASMAAFVKGGLVRGGRQAIEVNEEGEEFVIRNAALRKFGVGFFERLNRGLMPAMPAPAFAAAGGGGAGPVNVTAPPAEILIVNDEAAALRTLKSRGGKATIKRMVGNVLQELGFKK